MSRLSELPRAALLYAAFILLFFQSSWRSSGIASPDLFVRVDPAKQELVHGGEDLRQFYSWFSFASDNLRKGIFPSWTPFAGAGQPFVGKQQNAVFYPLNSLVYLSNDPRAFLLELALRFFLASMFTFLLSRKLGLDFVPAFISGCIFMISNCMTHWGIHAYSASAAFVPCVLLLTEHYLDGFRRRVLLLLPFAVALSFLGGHSESAVRGYLLAGIYLCARLWSMRKIPASERLWSAAKYVGFASLGALLGMVHLLPSAEYYFHSYTHVWRNLEEFAFSQHHVARSLTIEDSPLLIAGAIGLFFLGWGLKRLRSKLESLDPQAAGFAALSALGLALFLAACGSLGMTMDFWPHLTLHLKYDPTQAAWVGPLACAFGFFVFTFIGLALLDPETPLSIRILGTVFLAGLALIHRMPLISHFVYQLPLLKQFLPELSPETDLCMAVVAAFGLGRAFRVESSNRKKRFGSALLASSLWIVLFAGYALSYPLRSPLVDRLGIGQNAANAKRNPDPFVAILDGGQLMERAPVSYVVRVRVDHRAGPVRRILVGLAAGETRIGPVEARLLSTGSDYSFFNGRIEIPFDKDRFLLDAYPFAVVETSTGQRQSVGASEILVWSTPQLPEHWLIPVLFVLALSVLLVAGPRVLMIAALSLMGWWGFARGGAYFQPRVPLRSELLPSISSILRLQVDSSIFRVFSFDEHFFGPELSSNYWIADFRTWDALDVLEHIYYLRLLQSLAAQGHPDLAAKLLDLANVKYVLGHINDAPPLPGLKEIAKGELRIFENPGAMRRAAFFTATESLSFDEFKDWRTANQRGLPLVAGMLAQGLDPRRTLLLTDVPGLQSGSATKKTDEGRASIEGYRLDYAKVLVHAPTAGYLFFGDTYFPGWNALLDGKETSILRAWINFRAVPVPSGEHVVEFVYRPLSLLLGALVTVLTLLSLLWLWRRECAAGSSLGAVESLILGNVFLGTLYWGVWCALIYRGGSWSLRLLGLALLGSLALPLSAALKKR